MPRYQTEDGRTYEGADALALSADWVAKLPGNPSPEALFLFSAEGPAIRDSDLVLVNTVDRILRFRLCSSCKTILMMPMNSDERFVFYVKCRPQNADALSLAIKIRRVFIGYPPWRARASWKGRSIKSCMLDISALPTDWRHLIEDYVNQGQVKQNSWYAENVVPGCFAIIPKPGTGLSYVAKVTASFQLVDHPQWFEKYIALRKAQGLDTDDRQSHVGDVVQCWRVEKFVPVPFPLIPRWITYRLLSRNTVGAIEDRPDGNVTALEVIKSLYEGNVLVSKWKPTTNPEVVAQRLLDWVSPNAFEHLVCQLMQLENPHERWWHVGGSGDGGADGLAINGARKITGILQCKWKLGVDPFDLGRQLLDSVDKSWSAKVKSYVSFLFPSSTRWEPIEGVYVLGPREIASLILKHKSQLPVAVTLGIC